MHLFRRSIHVPCLFARVAAFAFTWSTSLFPVRAALPPEAFRDDQQKAPEALTVKVLQVERTDQKKGTTEIVKVVAQAEVLKVRRTASRLKAGEKITIAYTNSTPRRDPGWAGPQTYIPVLVKGDTVPAYLAGDRKSGYTPAASVYSFEEIR